MSLKRVAVFGFLQDVILQTDFRERLLELAPTYYFALVAAPLADCLLGNARLRPEWRQADYKQFRVVIAVLLVLYLMQVFLPLAARSIDVEAGSPWLLFTLSGLAPLLCLLVAPTERPREKRLWVYALLVFFGIYFALPVAPASATRHLTTTKGMVAFSLLVTSVLANVGLLVLQQHYGQSRIELALGAVPFVGLGVGWLELTKPSVALPVALLFFFAWALDRATKNYARRVNNDAFLMALAQTMQRAFALLVRAFMAGDGVRQVLGALLAIVCVAQAVNRVELKAK